VPEEIKDKLIKLRDAVPVDKEYRWESKEKLHITICFLGDVDENKISQIEDILEKANMFYNFQCDIPKFGITTMPPKHKILYAPVSSDQILFRLANYFSESLENLDILTDKKLLKAHITLLRAKASLDAGFITTISSAQCEKFSFMANEVILYESVLSSGGSTYKKLKSIYLSN